MKVNGYGMIIFVIKLATICLCINNVLSASLSDGQNISNEGSDISSTLVSTTMSAVETSTIDEDYDSEKSSTSETQDTKQPPLVFPSDDEKTETSKNETALEILQKNSNASTMDNRVISEESPSTSDDAVEDMDDTKNTTNDDKNNNNDSSNEETSQQPQQKKTDNDYDNLTDEEEEKDVENIQEENKEQGYLEEQFGFNSTSINSNPFEEPTLKGGHIAVIFASALVLLSLLAYIGLVLWRNQLESRYGMRQQLVTEDDYYNNNDVRFFGL